MKKPRPNHSAVFKARIAKEALQGIKQANQIAEENNLHPVHVSTWKKELKENMPLLFERKNESDHKNVNSKNTVNGWSGSWVGRSWRRTFC